MSQFPVWPLASRRELHRSILPERRCLCRVGSILGRPEPAKCAKVPPSCVLKRVEKLFDCFVKGPSGFLSSLKLLLTFFIVVQFHACNVFNNFSRLDRTWFQCLHFSENGAS